MTVIGGVLLPGLCIALALRAWRPQGGANQLSGLWPAVALCLGVGASAMTTSWVVMAGGDLDRTFVLVDASVWLGLGAIALAQRRTLERVADAAPTGRALEPMMFWPKAVFATVAVLSIAAATAGYWSSPHGDWDAWAIWNQKARFLVRAGDQWVDALAIGWAQPGHPMLVPATVARLWAYAGHETTTAPALIGVLFGAATVAVVMAALGLERIRAWVAGAVLLAPGIFLEQWTAQQADIPFAFFIVATLATLARVSTLGARSAPQLLLLGGSLAGLAAWTKNEGAVLVTATVLVVAVATGRGARLRSVAWWLLGSLPAIATLVWFKVGVAPEAPYYLPDGSLRDVLFDRLMHSDHRTIVHGALWNRLLAWGSPTMPGAVLVAVTVAAGAAAGRRGSGSRALLLVLSVMLGAYYAVYILTSLDVNWLIATTFDRLLVQLWPSIVLAAFLAPSHRHRDTRTAQSDLPAVAGVPAGHSTTAKSSMALDVVVPVYNEEASIDAFIERATAAGLRQALIFVDNASSDATVQKIAAHPDLRLIRHERNMGYGASIRDGVAHGTAPAVVIIDADLEYPLEAVAELVARLAVDPVVYGSRFATASAAPLPWIRRRGNQMLTAIFNWLHGQHITDLYTGLKAIRRDTWSTLSLRRDGFDHVAELAVALATSGHRISEVPIAYTPRVHGRSKMRHVPETLRGLREIVAGRTRSLFSN